MSLSLRFHKNIIVHTVLNGRPFSWFFPTFRWT